jgi:hypothetical protein
MVLLRSFFAKRGRKPVLPNPKLPRNSESRSLSCRSARAESGAWTSLSLKHSLTFTGKTWISLAAFNPVTFPTSPIPAKLTPSEYDRLVKLLTLHYAYPLPYPLAGAYFEELFASSVSGAREERKVLFDVLRDETGWSLKTILVGALGTRKTFEVVVQRCDILKDPKLSLNSTVEALGAAILGHFNRNCEASAKLQKIRDTRAGFLIRSRDERKFVFFQQRYRLYKPREVSWRWANSDRRSLMGSVGGSLVLRWYRSGTQLFGVYAIPEDAHKFEIDWRRAGLDETIEFFTRHRIAKAVKDS